MNLNLILRDKKNQLKKQQKNNPSYLKLTYLTRDPYNEKWINL